MLKGNNSKVDVVYKIESRWYFWNFL